MADENEVVETEVNDDVSNDIIKDDPSNVKEGSELDKILDDVAGIKRDVPAKKDTTTKETQVPQRQTTDSATGRKETQTTETGTGNRTPVNPAHTPRAYGKAFKWDAQGNVTLAATGEIIAPVGAPRKAFERMLPIISAAQTEADKYKGMYEAAASANTVAANLKLSPEEYAVGARIMNAFKSDPKKAVAFLIQEAQNNGVDMSDLGTGVYSGPTIDVIEQSVSKILEKIIEPFKFILEDRQAQMELIEGRNEAQTVVDEFLEQFPDADIHQKSLTLIMTAKPGTSLTEAYWILKANAAEQGLDWSKDLAPQVVARRNKDGNRAPNNGQPANRRELPDLNGRANNGSVVERPSVALSGLSDTKDIVRAAMLEAGMITE